MPQLPDLNHLSHAEKDALIHALWAQVQGMTARLALLEARLGEPAKTPDNSGLPPSRGQKPNQPEKAKRTVASFNASLMGLVVQVVTDVLGGDIVGAAEHLIGGLMGNGTLAGMGHAIESVPAAVVGALRARQYPPQ